MEGSHMRRQLTNEFYARKVWVLKVNGDGLTSQSELLGREWQPPVEGMPYIVHLGGGSFIKTGPVDQINRGPDALIVKTEDALYRLRYSE